VLPGALVWTGGRLLVSRAQNVVDEKGEITNAATRENIRRFIHGFAAFVGARPASR
jgi:chromate reductase, NAD(P)H dehydrogenase (quinone)